MINRHCCFNGSTFQKNRLKPSVSWGRYSVIEIKKQRSITTVKMLPRSVRRPTFGEQKRERRRLKKEESVFRKRETRAVNPAGSIFKAKEERKPRSIWGWGVSRSFFPPRPCFSSVLCLSLSFPPASNSWRARRKSCDWCGDLKLREQPVARASNTQKIRSEKKKNSYSAAGVQVGLKVRSVANLYARCSQPAVVVVVVVVHHQAGIRSYLDNKLDLGYVAVARAVFVSVVRHSKSSSTSDLLFFYFIYPLLRSLLCYWHTHSRWGAAGSGLTTAADEKFH